MLTKRIRDQPCEEGSAQWRLQQAITRASGLFISKEAGIIQVSGACDCSLMTTILTCALTPHQMLPRIQRQRHKRTTSSIASASSTPAPSEIGSGRPFSPLSMGKGAKADDTVAMMLQPLLEQEAQIE